LTRPQGGLSPRVGQSSAGRGKSQHSRLFYRLNTSCRHVPSLETARNDRGLGAETQDAGAPVGGHADTSWDHHPQAIATPTRMVLVMRSIESHGARVMCGTVGGQSHSSEGHVCR
jgi:hypothetical protein